MRTTRLGFSPADYIPEAIRDGMARRIAEAAGLALLGAAAAGALALATWSVRDPSFSHVVEAPVRNLLGFPGAAAADLLMQIFGIASVALLLVVAIIGWRLMARRSLQRPGLRLLIALLAVVLAAGLASTLPRTDRWPLPGGLGGFVGDAVLYVPRVLLGGFDSVARVVGALFCAMGTVLSIAYVGRRTAEEEAEELQRIAEEDAESSADDEPSVLMVWLGAVIHGMLSLKTMVQRRMAARRGSEMRSAPRPAPARPPRTAVRREPSFEAPAPTQEAARRPAPVVHESPEVEDEDIEDLPPFEIEPPQRAVPPAGNLAKVMPPAGALKPGKRAEREAQPSMFGTDGYDHPPLTLLAEPKKVAGVTISKDALEQNARLLEGVLDDFGVRGEIINVRPGPVVTLYELEPAPGTKSSRVISLAEDIARSMSAVAARVAVVQGRNAIGVELPNAKRETVYLRELLACEDFEKSKLRLPLCLGKTIGGEPVIVELARMPHLLIAGTTGSGKSVAINTMILSLLYRLTPEQCRLIMIDPKMLELSIYDGIPHLLTPVVTDPKKAVVALKWAVREMEDRYRKMSKVGVRNIDGFNARVQEAKEKGEVIQRTVQTGFDRETGEPIFENEVMDLEQLPYIVVIVDEMADLMMVAGKEIEGTVQRLAQMARAAGIHVVLATQRPSVDVITGTIKANFPTRISFQVTSKIDSRTILGEQGAEQLLGQGDMLYMAGGGRISRVHGPFVSDEEVEKVVTHLKAQGQPQYLDAITAEEDGPGEGDDGAVFDKGNFGEESSDLYSQAVQVVLRDKKCSTSYIQRRLQIGYNKAASLVERMEREGVVGAPNHAGKREILMEREGEAG
ncbi:MAG: DNA translocase FtsK 4TM domain-containing protein [Proteobacteria bacterium]|nr:DNA translocase FtsK 4TM domain-containing protein [Pseudomonadota bacterium]